MGGLTERHRERGVDRAVAATARVLRIADRTDPREAKDANAGEPCHAGRVLHRRSLGLVVYSSMNGGADRTIIAREWAIHIET